jgi:ABC-type phosphate transport system substrate-binding protein
MRQARMLLACLAVTVLAACGTDTLTAPEQATPPAAPRLDVTQCDGTLIMVIRADGTTAVECVLRNGQLGSGSGG